MRNNYGAIQIFFFPILRLQVITFDNLCFILGIISLLLFFIALFIVIVLQTIAIKIAVIIFFILVAIARKIDTYCCRITLRRAITIQEAIQKWSHEPYNKTITKKLSKEVKSDNFCYHKVRRVIFLQGEQQTKVQYYYHNIRKTNILIVK